MDNKPTTFITHGHNMRDKIDPKTMQPYEVIVKSDDASVQLMGVAKDKQLVPYVEPFDEVMDTPLFDNVHKPKHYMIIPAKDVEVIDVIRASLTEEQFKGYCKGNMIKYLLRDKLDADEDVSKAGAYVKFYEGELNE